MVSAPEDAETVQYVKPKRFGKVTISKMIDGVEDPYMDRYYLWRSRWFSIRLHHILRDDSDPDLHDHPWDFVSVMLRGGYTETRVPREALRGFRPGVTLFRQRRGFRAPCVLYRRAEDVHALHLDTPSVWTFVITGPDRRSWGYHTAEGWKSWRQYLFGERGHKPLSAV